MIYPQHWRVVQLNGKSPEGFGIDWDCRERTLDPPDEFISNLGLAHAYSGTCALDLDDLAAATEFWREKGVDIMALLDAPDHVGINSHVPNRAKLLFQLDAPLPSKHCGSFELRCAKRNGRTEQDVLPPSIHPDTMRPYDWDIGLVGDPAQLPPLPEAILEFWKAAVAPRPAPTIRREHTQEWVQTHLDHISPEQVTYPQWVEVGQALQSWDQETGLELWDAWSKNDPDRYKGMRDLAKRWRGFSAGGGITLATLERLAHRPTPTDYEDLGPLTAEEAPISGAIADGGHQQDRFRVWRPDEFGQLPPVRWHVKGVLPRGGVSMVVGEPGSGKSFLTLDLACAVARGAEWFGNKVTAARVLILAAEGQAGYLQRVRAYAEHHKVELGSLDLGVMTDVPNLLAGDHVAVAREARRFGAGLILIDTVAQVTPGANENASEDMGAFLGHLRQIAQATGATVLLVHHTGKDTKKGARGWSGLNGAAAAVLTIDRADPYRSVRVSKQKDGSDGTQWGFKLNIVPLGFDEDGDPITSCVVEQSDQAGPDPQTKREGRLGVRQRKVLQYLHGILPSGSGQTTVGRIVAEMKRAGDDESRHNTIISLQALAEKGYLEMEGDLIELFTPANSSEVDISDV